MKAKENISPYQDLDTFCEELYQDMTSQIQKVALAMDDDLQKNQQSFHTVQTAMMKLKAFIRTYTFTDKNQEIHFFKEIKPRFHRELIYMAEVIYMETHRPYGSRELMVNFYRQVIDRIQIYFDRHNILYLYYRSGMCSEDKELFLRESDCIQIVPDDTLDIDDTFSTVASSKLAKIQAFERVIELAENKIQRLERSELNEAAVSPQARVVWTDSKNALIELLYALHSRKALNYGQIDLKQLVKVIEDAFNVKLGNLYRAFQAMRIRKKNRTIFLDILKDSLLNHMDKADELYS